RTSAAVIGSEIAKPRHGATMAGVLRSARGGVSPLSPPSQPRQSAEQARNRDHHSSDPCGQDRKQQKGAQAKNHTRASLSFLAPPQPPRGRPNPDTPWDCPWSDTRHRGKNLQAIDVKTLAGVRRETVELDLVDPAGAGRGAISG